MLGVALSLEGRCALTVARALIGACSQSPLQTAVVPIIAIERGRGPEWSELFHAIAEAGAEIRPMGARAHSVMNDAVALLGRKPAGFRLVPDLTAKPIGLRRPRLERQELWRKPAVALIGDGLGEVVPLRRTLWMQSFSDDQARDRFHVWLAHRLDRWEAWGRMAYARGGQVLTQHLLAMVMTAPDDPEGGFAPGRARRLP